VTTDLQDHATSHWQLLRPDVSEEEVLPLTEVRLDPQECLTRHDECHDVKDPARRQVMQFDLIISEQVAEELMGQQRQPPLMKGSE
jgi:hypothetical protein